MITTYGELMESHLNSTMTSFIDNVMAALYASDHQVISLQDLLSTTTTPPERYEGSYVVTVITDSSEDTETETFYA